MRSARDARQRDARYTITDPAETGIAQPLRCRLQLVFARRVMHVSVRQTQVGQMRNRHERATDADQYGMSDGALIEVDDDAAGEKEETRHEEPERAKAPMTPEPDDECRRRQHAGERDEATLETMIGKE